MNSPKEVAQYYIATGTAKTKLPILKMLLLGLMAGMFIALAGVGSTIAAATITTYSLARVISAMVFPTGLAMVLIAGSELFTGNCLIIIPVLEREVKLRAMLRNWVFVYIGNFIGSILIAALTVYGGTFSLFGNNAAVYLINTAVTKVSLPFESVLMRGILCNLLVCVAVWMTYAAKDVVGKIVALYLPIMLFVLSNYEHSIANMFFIPAGLFSVGNIDYYLAYSAVHGATSLTNLTWGSLFVRNLIPSTIGNIIGGMVLVGVVYWLVYLRDPDKKAAAKPARKKK